MALHKENKLLQLRSGGKKNKPSDGWIQAPQSLVILIRPMLTLDSGSGDAAEKQAPAWNNKPGSFPMLHNRHGNLFLFCSVFASLAFILWRGGKCQIDIRQRNLMTFQKLLCEIHSNVVAKWKRENEFLYWYKSNLLCLLWEAAKKVSSYVEI